MRPGPKPRPAAERFWRFVAKRDGDECWEWMGARNRYRRDYGTFGADGGRMVYAHRFSFELHHGPIPEGMFVCHRCDNPPCVRPDHLFLGRPKDNTADMDRKGRRVVRPLRGEAHAFAKITAGDVLAIRQRCAAGEFQRVVGADYGIDQRQVSNIVLGKSWSHV